MNGSSVRIGRQRYEFRPEKQFRVPEGFFRQQTELESYRHSMRSGIRETAPEKRHPGNGIRRRDGKGAPSSVRPTARTAASAGRCEEQDGNVAVRPDPSGPLRPILPAIRTGMQFIPGKKERNLK